MVPNPIGDQVIHTSIALGVVDTIAVALRLLARWRSKADIAADDILIILCLLPLYAMIIIGSWTVQHAGMGLPMETLRPSQISSFLKLMMSGIVTYTLTITMVKISILTLYRRIFITSAFRRKTVIVGLACLIWFFVAFFMDLSQCHPFQDAFNPKYLFTRHCINLQGYYWGISAANLVLDVIVLSLPLHMVWSLQLPMKQKLYLSGVFLLGGVVCIAGAMRIVAIGILQKEDITVTMAAEYLWTQVEPATAIFCACVVTYRPLFTNINLNISKFSGLFSKSGNIGSSDSSDWKDINDERNTKLQSHGGSGWLGREVVHFQDLNAKELVDTPSYQADRKRPYIESKPSRSIDIMDARPKPFPKDNYSRG